MISIHALRGEGDVDLECIRLPFIISIHALRGEGDASAYALDLKAAHISIHALRGEGDPALR